MKDVESIHQKVQEHCDCFATTDPLKEMSAISTNADASDAAIKWLALAALHGINNNAKKISIKKTAEGGAKVTAKYRSAELPSPGDDVSEKIIAAVKEIAHFEGDVGKIVLALGIRDSSVDLKVKLKKSNGGQKLTINFPE